jgi:hypothetical protein
MRFLAIYALLPAAIALAVVAPNAPDAGPANTPSVLYEISFASTYAS